MTVKVRETLYHDLDTCPMMEGELTECPFCPYHAIPYEKGKWVDFLICTHEDALETAKKGKEKR